MSDNSAGKAIGVGGVFFRSANPAGLGEWYRDALGLGIESWGDTSGTSFSPSAMPQHAFTVWSVFPDSTEYFGDSGQGWMINLVVDDLDAALARVSAAGAQVLPNREEHDFGRFGWFIDPDGHRVELWQPPEQMPTGDGTEDA
jgi:predicted enzyme related to lactoylglutathione lyase